MCLQELLYIWGYTRSLRLGCIGIQTLMKALYTQLQAIFPSPFRANQTILLYFLS
jgi:hypothetical protein